MAHARGDFTDLAIHLCGRNSVAVFDVHVSSFAVIACPSWLLAQHVASLAFRIQTSMLAFARETISHLPVLALLCLLVLGKPSFGLDPLFISVAEGGSLHHIGSGT